MPIKEGVEVAKVTLDDGSSYDPTIDKVTLSAPVVDAEEYRAKLTETIGDDTSTVAQLNYEITKLTQQLTTLEAQKLEVQQRLDINTAALSALEAARVK